MNTRDTLYVENGSLYIGKFKATELAARFGTPLYVMDGDYIDGVCGKMLDALSSYGDGAVAFASKAFATVATTRLMANRGMWFDCVSGGELYMLLSAGVNPKHIIFHGNAKTPREIAEGVADGIGYFAIDGVREIDTLDGIAGDAGVVQDVLVRVNPCVSAHTFAAVQTAAPNSKFGFDVYGDALDYILDINSRKNLNFKGLHLHIGSQIYDHTSYQEAVNVITSFMLKLHESGIDVEVLDLGGGFGIFYTEEDPKFTPNRYAYTLKNVTDMLSSALSEKELKKPFVIFEPGRSVVGEAGVTLYTVTDVKDFPGVKKYVAIDGGMFDNPRHALYGSQYSACVADKASDEASERVTIAGKCCESGDLIAEDIPLQHAEPGDVVAVFSTGAYNYSMASNYNMNAIPPVVLVRGDKADYIIKPQDYADLTRRDVVPEWI